MKVYYLPCDKNPEIIEYDDLYDCLEDIITEDYVVDILNECYDYFDFPVIGQKGLGDIIKAFNAVGEVIDGEIDSLYDEISYVLSECGDDYFEFILGMISNSKEVLEHLQKED